jgi:anti-sigma factor RsiW
MDEREIDHALTELLAERLPQHPAPLALKRRLAEQWLTPPARSWRRRAVAIPALAAAVLLLVALPVAYDRMVVAPGRATDALLTEAVNDHVRVLQSPLGVESTGMHDVKPWFTGKLDFAPVVGFMGDAEFPLKGGAVGYYVDRPAAVVIFGRRRHTMSLLVFRAEGLPLPARVTTSAVRGFNVMLWRDGALGYALVSDVDRAELTALGAKLRGD